jgi:hypothetical protein
MKGSRIMQQWSRRRLLVGGMGILVTGCTHAWAGDVPYSVGVQGEGNRVALASSAGAAGEGYVVAVTSPRGIGQATVAWWGSRAPQQLTFHLELTGLEHFQLRWADTNVTVSVNTSDQQVWQSVQKGESGEEVLMADSPFWTDIKLPTAERGGYTVIAPFAFLSDGPRLWAFGWIDFYR